jgi:hypothetical protein
VSWEKEMMQATCQHPTCELQARDEALEEAAKEVEDRATCVVVGVNKQYWNGRDDAATLIRALKTKETT